MYYWNWFRTAAAFVALSGVVAGLVVNVDRATRMQQDLGLVLANYFSMFTIVSALLSVVVLLTASAWSQRHPDAAHESLGIALAMASVAAPVILLGLVYNILLRGLGSSVALGDSAGIAMLDNYAIESLHVVLPLYFVVDLLFAPRRHTLPWWSLGVIVGYPLVWIGYTMIRGELVPNPDGSTPWWYPYPFLDPHGAGGYGTALIYIGAIFVGFVAIGAIIVGVDRFRAKRADARIAAAPVAAEGLGRLT